MPKAIIAIKLLEFAIMIRIDILLFLSLPETNIS
jgi:hypothetical protein